MTTIRSSPRRAARVHVLRGAYARRPVTPHISPRKREWTYTLVLTLTPFLDVNGDVDVDPIVDLDFDANPRQTRSVNVRPRRWSQRPRRCQRQRRPSTFMSTITSPSTM